MTGLIQLMTRRLPGLALIAVAIVMAAVSTLVAVGQTTGPGDDPTQEPIPEIQVPDSAQSIVVTVFFNSATDVEVVDSAVNAWSAPGRSGGPPMIHVEVLDVDGNIIEGFNDWHPLWVENLGGDDQQGTTFENSGEGRFIFPFYPNIGTVEISDIQLGQTLVEVDAHEVVVDYCAVNRDDPACDSVPGLCLADVNGDGTLDLLDAIALARALGSKPGDSRWNPAADLNGDEVIRWDDFWILLQSFHDPACR